MGIRPATQVSLHDRCACALHDGGLVSCWGACAASDKPKQVIASLPAVRQLSYPCALTQDNSVYCWGARPDQNGITIIDATPQPISPLSDAESLGGFCAMRPLGQVSCWAFNDNGQIGDGTMTPRASPSDVVGLSW